MEFIPLRTLDEQMNAVGEWQSPAFQNFMRGVRFKWEKGLLPKTKLV